MIELVDICKSYRTRAGRKQILRSVNVEFPACEGIGILGRNGAGKSTLLRIIGGAEMPDSGEVVRSGRVSWPIGFNGGFNGSLSGEENCRFVARIYSQDVDRVVDETRQFAEIGEYFFEPIRTYSSGMRARLAFGLSMAVDFDVYLVDEVTAVGDENFRRKCRAAFAERRERSTIIMASHNVSTLRDYCSRCAVLVDGVLEIFDSVDHAVAVHNAALARSNTAGIQLVEDVHARAS